MPQQSWSSLQGIYGINLAIWPLMARVMTLRMALFLTIKEGKGDTGLCQAENDLFHVSCLVDSAAVKFMTKPRLFCDTAQVF